MAYMSQNKMRTLLVEMASKSKDGLSMAELKALAHQVTLDVDHHGVAAAVKKFLL